jgi:hypothetical protein
MSFETIVAQLLNPEKIRVVQEDLEKVLRIIRSATKIIWLQIKNSKAS